MTDTPRRKAHVLAPFADAGTGQAFDVGATPMLDAGAFANYEAAGLVRAHTAADSGTRAAAKPKPSARKRTARKAPAPAPATTPTEPVSSGEEPA